MLHGGSVSLKRALSAIMLLELPLCVRLGIHVSSAVSHLPPSQISKPPPLRGGVIERTVY